MSSSFQQNWIHSIRTSFAKVMAVQVLLLELVRRWSGVSGQRTRNLRPLVFPALRQLVWCRSGVSPEYHRRVPGVSGKLEYPVLLTGVSGLWKRHRQDSARVRSLRPAPEFLVPQTGVSGPPRSVLCVVPPWCQSGGSPEGVRSLRHYPGVSGLLGRSLRPKWFPTVTNRGGV